MGVDRTTAGIAVSAANPRQSAVVPPEWRNAAGSNAVWTGELSLTLYIGLQSTSALNAAIYMSATPVWC